MINFNEDELEDVISKGLQVKTDYYNGISLSSKDVAMLGKECIRLYNTLVNENAEFNGESSEDDIKPSPKGNFLERFLDKVNKKYIGNEFGEEPILKTMAASSSKYSDYLADEFSNYAIENQNDSHFSISYLLLASDRLAHVIEERLLNLINEKRDVKISDNGDLFKKIKTTIKSGNPKETLKRFGLDYKELNEDGLLSLYKAAFNIKNKIIESMLVMSDVDAPYYFGGDLKNGMGVIHVNSLGNARSVEAAFSVHYVDTNILFNRAINENARERKEWDFMRNGAPVSERDLLFVTRGRKDISRLFMEAYMKMLIDEPGKHENVYTMFYEFRELAAQIAGGNKENAKEKGIELADRYRKIFNDVVINNGKDNVISQPPKDFDAEYFNQNDDEIKKVFLISKFVNSYKDYYNFQNLDSMVGMLLAKRYFNIESKRYGAIINAYKTTSISNDESKSPMDKNIKVKYFMDEVKKFDHNDKAERNKYLYATKIAFAFHQSNYSDVAIFLGIKEGSPQYEYMQRLVEVCKKHHKQAVLCAREVKGDDAAWGLMSIMGMAKDVLDPNSNLSKKITAEMTNKQSPANYD